ncbi:tyrosine-type recombinase/integrase [Flavobacterium sp. GNP001]
MNVRIIIKSNNLYCRLTAGRQIDISKKIGISIPTEHWDSVKQKIKNSYKLPNKDKINAKLFLLKSKITDKYNFDNINGEVIDGIWLEKAIDEAFGRVPITAGKIETWKIYLLDFCKHWLKNESTKINATARQQYTVFVDLHLTNYLKEKSLSKIKIKEVTNKTIEDFIDYLLGKNYSSDTVKRHANRFKFFLNRAENMNLQVNRNYKESVKVSKETEIVKEIYLNEDEIERIYKLDYSDNITLDNIRDNFIIGLCTGLRVSDFNNNLNQSNIVDGFIEIKTKKTGTAVAIPLHKYIVEILKKRNGNLPKKVNDAQFNESIKDVCRDAKINETTKGLVFDKATKRNKLDYYEKYKLVSSHICRRSFATNLFGKVPNYVIQAVGGWATEKMMLHYIKKSNREQAEELKKYWEEQN